MSSVTSEILKQHFLKKKKDSPGFSIRSLANRLEISNGYVSQIMNGKRNLPSEFVDDLCDILDIDFEKKNIMTVDVLKSQGWKRSAPAPLLKTQVRTQENSSWVSAPKKDLNLLENWYLLAILDATQLVDYDGSNEFLAKRLSLEVSVVRRGMERLLEAGYIETDERGFLIKKQYLLEFQSRNKKRDLANFHGQIFEKAKKVMKEQGTEEQLQQRLISTMILTCSREQIPEIRMRIADFLRNIAGETARQTPEELYVVGSLFFPLSEVTSE